MKVNPDITADNRFTKLEADELIGVVNTNASSIIQLPTTINAVVGDTLQLFYRSMVTSAIPYNYHFRVDCAIGGQFPRYYEVTPVAPSTQDITIEIIDKDGTIMATATSSLVVKAAVGQPAALTNVWSIGDSLTNGKPWTTEFERRITGTGGTPVGHAYGNFFQHVEGNSGKEWNWYATSVDSPFVYAGVLNFEQYRIDNGLNVPTVAYFLLTWNGMGSERDDAQWDVWDDDVYDIIDAITSDFPGIQIKLMCPQLPSINGALGVDYGAQGLYYSDLQLQIGNVKRQALIYDRISNEGGYTNVEFIDTAAQVDSENNMPEALHPVNTRSAKTEYRGTSNGGVHPSTEGYYQIADAAYRIFINQYCQ